MDMIAMQLINVFAKVLIFVKDVFVEISNVKQMNIVSKEVYPGHVLMLKHVNIQTG